MLLFYNLMEIFETSIAPKYYHRILLLWFGLVFLSIWLAGEFACRWFGLFSPFSE